MFKQILAITAIFTIGETAFAQSYNSGPYNYNSPYSWGGPYPYNYGGAYGRNNPYGNGGPFNFGGQGYRRNNPYAYTYPSANGWTNGGYGYGWNDPYAFRQPAVQGYPARPPIGYDYYPEYTSSSPLPNMPGVNTSAGKYLSTLNADLATAGGSSPATATVIDQMSTSNKPAPATISVIVPEGGQVWFNSKLNPPKSGLKWTYTTDTLQPGQSTRIPVKATWKENGKDEEYSLRVPVEAGDTLTIDLHARK